MLFSRLWEVFRAFDSLACTCLLALSLVKSFEADFFWNTVKPRRASTSLFLAQLCTFSNCYLVILPIL